MAGTSAFGEVDWREQKSGIRVRAVTRGPCVPKRRSVVKKSFVETRDTWQ